MTGNGGRGVVQGHGPIIVGLAGIFVALFIGLNSTRSASIDAERQRDAERAREAREQRAVVYADFLEDSNCFAVASTALFQASAGCVQPLADCAEFGDATGEWRQARFEFQGAINKVYIYGSADANAVVEDIAESLPNSLGDLTVPRIPST